MEYGAKVWLSNTGIVGKSATGNGVHAESLSRQAISCMLNRRQEEYPGRCKFDDLCGYRGRQYYGHGIWGESTADNAGLVEVNPQLETGFMLKALAAAFGLNAVSASDVGVRAKGGSLAGYFEGNVQVTGDIGLVNADCAEEFDTRMQVDPGTVMVIDNNGLLEASSKPY